MELMNIKEFFKNNNCSTQNINLYLKYLSEKRKEISASLDLSSTLSLSEDIINDFTSQINFIDGLDKIIRDSFSESVSITIDKLSDWEFREIVNRFIFRCCEDMKALRQDLDEVNDLVSNFDSDRKKELENKGYKNEYYAYPDTELFFKKKVSSKEYLEELISVDISKEELTDLFGLIYPDVKEKLADMLIKLRKIVSISNKENILSEVAKSFLSIEGIGKIIGASSLDECLEVFNSLQREQKINTEFFTNLPDDLKKAMLEEDFIPSGVFGTLKDIYLDYKLNGYVILPNDETKSEVVDQVRKQYEIDAKLTELKEKLDFLSSDNYSELRKYIKEYFNSSLDDDALSINILTNKVDDYKLAKENYQDRSKKILNQITIYNALADKISKILENEDNKDFEILAARNSLRLMNALGPDATEESVYPMYEAENRRVKQLEILIEAIKELNLIKEKIDEIDNSRNIIKNISGANKKERANLIDVYQEKCQECYDQLNIANLLYIVVSHSYMDKEEEIFMKPKNFKGLFDKCNILLYEASESSYQELKLRDLLPENATLDELNDLFKVAYAFGNKLFTAKCNKEGIFEFDLNDEEMNILMEAQKEIAKIYDGLYHHRLDERKQLANLSLASISSALKNVVDELNISESSVTRETLEQHRCRLMFEVAKEQEELDSIERVLAEKKEISSNITINDALEYYKMLEGFDTSVLPKNEIMLKI